MRTKAVKTLLPLPPTDTWDALVAPEYPPLFSSLPEVHVARWVGNYLIAQPRVPGGMSVNIARVFNRPHRLEVASRSGRVWVSLFDADPQGTVWTAWIEGDFDAPPPSGISTDSRNWLEYYEVQLTRWSEAFSSMGWLLTGSIPEDMRWTLDLRRAPGNRGAPQSLDGVSQSWMSSPGLPGPSATRFTLTI